MDRWRVLALMTFAQAGASVVQQALGSLSPVLVATYGLTQAQLGLIFSAMMLGAASFTAPAGILTDRWGERRVLIVASLAMTAVLCAAGQAPSYPWFVVCIGAFGVAYAASTPAGGRAILTWFDRDRGFAMSLRQTGVSVGAFAGALILPPLARALGARGALTVSAAILLVPALIAFVLYRERTVHDPDASLRSVLRGMREVARDRRFLAVTVTSMALICGQLALMAFLTVTGVAVVHLSAATAALAFATAQAAAVVARPFWGFASDRVFGGDRYLPFAVICAIAAAASALLACAQPHAVALFFLASAVLGFTAAGYNGLMATALAEIGGVRRAGSALGLALTAIFSASSVAPLVFGTIADRASLHVAWWVMAVFICLASLPVLRVRASTFAASAARSSPAQIVRAAGCETRRCEGRAGGSR